MGDCFLLSRALFRFASDTERICRDLSAATITDGGYLWLGSDEGATLERLEPQGPLIFGDHRSFPLKHYLDLDEATGEVDIEGLAYADHYLWLTGSHSSKRKKPKGKKPASDLERLTIVESDPNRYTLARIPVVGGTLHRSCANPERPAEQLTAAMLQKRGSENNELIDALRDDPHLGPFLTFPLPSKENGFDIEGLTVSGNRIFLGFRGPVLSGWAIILELVLEDSGAGELRLCPLGKDGALYRKHFADLNGLGVRELLIHGDDLIVLTGPTMTLAGLTQLVRVKGLLKAGEDTMFSLNSEQVELIGDLPWNGVADNAEGLAGLSWLGHQGLLVVYDNPDPRRMVAPGEVFGDVFLLPE